MPSTYVITGTSGGIGLELTRQLASRGDVVYALCRTRASSAKKVDALSDLEKQFEGRVKIIEGVDVASDGVGQVLNKKLDGVTIDVLVHNAGSANATRDLKGMDVAVDQNFAAVTMQRMRDCFELNTLGPLRVQKALHAQMASSGGKVVVISTGMGSIADNTSGGFYAYRTSKAAVNMVTKGMSVDLKEQGVSVVAVNPNMVMTDFGPGREAMQQWGAMTVEASCQGLIKVMDDLSLENTGRFMTVPKEGEPKEFPAGW